MSGLPSFISDKIHYDDPKTMEETVRKEKCLYNQHKGNPTLQRSWEDKRKFKREKRQKGNKPPFFRNSPQGQSVLSEPRMVVVGKSPCGQVDLLLRARLLTLRQKVLNMDTDFLLYLIKLMNKREGGKHVPYERRLSLQGPGCASILSSLVDPTR
jgi:hypothetical protein